MIDLKQGRLLYDPVPSDVPPSYDTQESASGFHRDNKTLDSVVRESFAQSSSSHGKNPSMALHSDRFSWFNSGTSRTTKQTVHSTILNILRDIVKQKCPTTGSVSDILESLSETCHSYSISFSSLLQQKSIENHTPLFWAIILRRPLQLFPSSNDLVITLLSHSTPLMSATIAEMRHACLLTSDHALFQRFRLYPSFSPLSGADEMILGTSLSPDTIEVEEIESDRGDFLTKFKILEFQKRMRVSNQIRLEFIARGRMWRLSFDITWRLKWVVRLSILKGSPGTPVDSCLIIEEASPRSSVTCTPTEALLTNAAITNAQSIGKQTSKNREKPQSAIHIPLRTTHDELSTWGTVEGAVDNSSAGSSLQYDNCPYVDAEGVLKGQLKARLAKS